MEKRTEEKKQRLLGSLERGMTMVHLDARRPGVIVPTHLKGEAHLLLNLSYRFDPPDLAVSEWGVRSTLTFGGKRFTVGVPWSALYAISSHVTKEFWMYPDDMPKELIDSALVKQMPQPSGPDDPKPPEANDTRAALREVLRAVPALENEAPQEEGEAPKDPPDPPKRGHLRLVK